MRVGREVEGACDMSSDRWADTTSRETVSSDVRRLFGMYGVGVGALLAILPACGSKNPGAQVSNKGAPSATDHEATVPRAQLAAAEARLERTIRESGRGTFSFIDSVQFEADGVVRAEVDGQLLEMTGLLTSPLPPVIGEALLLEVLENQVTELLAEWATALELERLPPALTRASVVYRVPGTRGDRRLQASLGTLEIEDDELAIELHRKSSQYRGPVAIRFSPVESDDASDAACGSLPEEPSIVSCSLASIGGRRGLVLVGTEAWLQEMKNAERARLARSIRDIAELDAECMHWQVIIGNRRVAWGQRSAVMVDRRMSAMYATEDGARIDADASPSRIPSD